MGLQEHIRAMVQNTMNNSAIAQRSAEEGTIVPTEKEVALLNAAMFETLIAALDLLAAEVDRLRDRVDRS